MEEEDVDRVAGGLVSFFLGSEFAGRPVPRWVCPRCGELAVSYPLMGARVMADSLHPDPYSIIRWHEMVHRAPCGLVCERALVRYQFWATPMPDYHFAPNDCVRCKRS